VVWYEWVAGVVAKWGIGRKSKGKDKVKSKGKGEDENKSKCQEYGKGESKGARLPSSVRVNGRRPPQRQNEVKVDDQ